MSEGLSAEVQCVVFDAVGTLLWANPPVAEAYAEVGRQFGSRRSVQEVRERFHCVFDRMEQQDRAGAMTTSEERERRRWYQIVSEVLDDVSDQDGCFQVLFDHFARAESWSCYPDVQPVFQELKQAGITTAVASNFDSRLRQVCRGHEVLRHCETFISAEVGYRKPHPAFFQAIEARLRLPPHALLHVGDDGENDCRGALQAGWHSVWICRSGRPPAVEQGPDSAGQGARIVIRSLGDLLTILRRDGNARDVRGDCTQSLRPRSRYD